MAVRRSSCSDASLQRRSAAGIALRESGNRPLGIDGYNLLITIESALSGGLILVGRDGCHRDLASVHGTYRRVEETVPAVELIAGHLTTFNIPRIDWYLDRPVSNSGRLKALMAGVLEAKASRLSQGAPWNIELVDCPDAVLSDYAGVVATSDSAILDRCRAWVNLAADIINAHIRQVWRIDLRTCNAAS